MHKPNVLTGQTAPISIPNPIAGASMGQIAGIPNPDTAIQVLNSTLVPMLLGVLLQQKYSPKTKSSFQPEYDYIVVGAGAAGSVIANRLSEKECVNILLLEAGKTPPVLSEIPGMSIGMLFTDANWNFWTEPQEHTAEEQYQHRIPYGSGKGLGGSTLVNALLYSRGNKQDYDDWEAMGAKGWSYKAVLPYFLKLENNTDLDLVADGCHNVSGPMTFSRVRYTSYLKKPIIEGAKSLGYEVVDSNCEKQLGFTDLQVAMRHGQRCSAAKAYLVPADDRRNLDIVTQAFVTKIQITNNAAQGVCFDHKGSSHFVKARREVIVSAGAVSSPKLLILSGIGPRKTLEKFNITMHKDLPVGENLNDHVSATIFFYVPSGTPYIENLLRPENIAEYSTNRSGPIASNGVFSIGFHRSADAATPEHVPNFESYFTEGDNIVAKYVYGLNPSAYKQLFHPYETSATMWCFSSVVNPKSRGFVTIKSTDPFEDPVIDPKFLSHPQDLTNLVAGLKLCLDVATTLEAKKAGIKPFETKIPGCEDVAHDRDKYLKCYVKKFTFSIWHPAGTVKMGRESDPTTAVDPKFRVKGIEKLRVIDASAMPKVVSGNTMVPTMMMAEKGSDIIKETISEC